ncbi:transcriptional regulator [Wohlfahrtiimonas chitiniclastica]|uniref:YerC/YecD family TrpR-related protein n=1 Tax=Wohlfahrtiimonas TaxID=582472 RepID=UPI000B985BF7|nr:MULTISPECIES: YerC/YecD family TrpR-related protein [Wohlfahrtiimonas]MBS7838231.1 transcriptional regulator [Wohlfahrtiimonas chitiniclastica]OYQ73429.1 transcriptional regulator [Wohlfahrtiimonas sp. G9077]OYQ77792.1 transcriptional regulator [Wohlfahrtiimonas chitiniclastica]
MKNEDYKALCDALLTIEDAQSMNAFLRDLCTPNEYAAFVERWRVCRLLAKEQYSYREIHALTGASLTTIGRVARFLKDENNNGYTAVLAKIDQA